MHISPCAVDLLVLIAHVNNCVILVKQSLPFQKFNSFVLSREF